MKHTASLADRDVHGAGEGGRERGRRKRLGPCWLARFASAIVFDEEEQRHALKVSEKRQLGGDGAKNGGSKGRSERENTRSHNTESKGGRMTAAAGNANI